MFDLALPKLFNRTLLSEPLNWTIVFVFASIWLLLFHVIMQAFGAMQSTSQASVGAAPGQTVSPVASTSQFSVQGLLAGGVPSVPSVFEGSSATVWTDSYESKFAEDGWYGNP